MDAKTTAVFFVTEREFDTIIASLRLWQLPQSHIGDGDGSLADMAEEHGEALTNEQIDDFIVRINFQADYSTRKKSKAPLEKLKLVDHCQMCGDHDHTWHRAHLEPGFDPSGRPRTMCQQCRIGSWELLQERAAKAKQFIELVSRMKTEEEYGDDAPPSEDWICTLNELIESARKGTR